MLARLSMVIACWLIVAPLARADEPAWDDPAVLQKTLDQKLPLMDQQKAPVELARQLATFGNANIYVDTDALTAAEIPLDRKMTLSLQNVTLRVALDRFAKALSTPKVAGKWAISGGVIVISTDADKNFTQLQIAQNAVTKDETFRDDRIIPEINLEAQPLSEALKFLADNGINTYLHEAVLKGVDVTPHDRVSLVLKNVRPRTVMTLLTRQLAGPSARVSFAIRDSVWVISTPAGLETQLPLWDWRPHHVKDQATANKLANVVEDATVHGPLAEAAEGLGRANDVIFDIDWTNLAAAGIERTTPVTLSVRHIKLSTVIDLLLCEAGGKAAQLDYIAEDGTIRVKVKPPPTTKPTTKPVAKPATRPVKKG